MIPKNETIGVVDTFHEDVLGKIAKEWKLSQRIVGAADFFGEETVTAGMLGTEDDEKSK